MNEAEFTETVIQMAKLYGWHVAHFRPSKDRKGEWRTAMSGDPGFPDLVMARNGQVLFIELKSATGVTSPEQDGWLQALAAPAAAHGNYVRVWRPQDLDQIKRLLGARAMRSNA